MNQRRHAKAFPLVATLVTAALAICFVTFAVKALMVKYQVVQGGTKIKQLERELNSLALNNQDLLATKTRLTSTGELKKKLLEGYFKGLLEIKENAIISVEGSATAGQPPDGRLTDTTVAAIDPNIVPEEKR